MSMDEKEEKEDSWRLSVQVKKNKGGGFGYLWWNMTTSLQGTVLNKENQISWSMKSIQVTVNQ